MSEDIPAYPFGRHTGLSIDQRYRRPLRDEPISRVHLPYGGDAWLLLDFAVICLILGVPESDRDQFEDRSEPQCRSSRAGLRALPAIW
jgi:hypothetical protein